MNDQQAKLMKSGIDTIFRTLVDMMAAWGVDDIATAKHAAALFCAMSDDGQARFFSEVAAIMGSWGSGKAESQAHYIGRHLRGCECATEAGRDLVVRIAEAVTP